MSVELFVVLNYYPLKDIMIYRNIFCIISVTGNLCLLSFFFDCVARNLSFVFFF